MTKKQNDLALCSVFLLSSLLLTGSPASAERSNWFTPACADRDLRALAAIEQFGEFEEMPHVWLADAGLSFLQARIYCLAGNETDGIALYDRIIAGDARLSAGLRVK